MMSSGVADGQTNLHQPVGDYGNLFWQVTEGEEGEEGTIKGLLVGVELESSCMLDCDLNHFRPGPTVD